MSFVFPSPVIMVKSHERRNIKIIFVSLPTIWRNVVAVNKIKMMDFDYREEYLKGVNYIKQNIFMAVLKKAHSHSLLIRRLIRKSIM